MWFSPFIAEMGVWAKWWSAGVFWEREVGAVLGGAGFLDVLFWPGAQTLFTLIGFHILRHLMRNHSLHLVERKKQNEGRLLGA
jgi:hypothetical protein